MPENQGGASRVSRGILRASIVVVVAHVLIKLLGVMQNRFLGGAFGAGVELDAYVVTFEGVIWTIFLVGEESLGPAFLPLFMERKDKGDEAGAWKFASTIIVLQAVLLAIATVLVIAIPTRVIEILTQWSASSEILKDERLSLAGGMLRIMAPGLFGLSIASTTYMLLNGYKKFFWAAFGDGTLKIAIILSVVVPGMLSRFFPSLGPVHPLYVAVGVLAGSYGKLLTHLPGLWRKLRHFRISVDVSDPQFRRFMVLIAPLLIGIVYAKVRDIYNNYWVLSSLEEGLISINSWGKKIYGTIGFVLPFAVSIAMFPYFCELVDRKDSGQLGRTITSSIRVILFLLFPAAAGLMLVSVPLAKGLYQVQKFSAEDAFLAGSANAAYTFALPFWAAEMILMQAFFSNRRTVAPIVIGIIWSTVSIIISYVGVVRLELTGLSALICVAGGFAFARAAKAVTLSVVLGRSIPLFRGEGDLIYFPRLAVLSALVALMIWATREGAEAALAAFFPEGLPSGRALTLAMLFEVALCGAAGAAGLAVGGLLLRMREFTFMLEWTRERLSLKRKY